MPQLLFCGGIKTKSTINLCFVWQCHLGHGNMPQEWRSAPECGNVPQNMTEHGDVPQTWWQWGCCRLIVFYLFFISQCGTNSFFCLSHWFLDPLWGNYNQPVCLLGFHQGFLFCFHFYPGTAALLFFLMLLFFPDHFAMRRLPGWLNTFLFFRVESFVIYCINLFWNLLLQFWHT